MKYYIYGGGGNGRVIAWIIEFLNAHKNLQDCYEIIDDSCKERSLKTFCSAIKKEQESLILIASKTYQEVMIKKLKDLGLHNFVNGIAFMGNELNRYFKECFPVYRNVAFLLDDVGLKHFGNIDNLLHSRGYNIFYFFFEHKTELQNNFLHFRENSFMVTEDFLEYFDFCYLMVGTSMHYRFASRVKYFRLLASYDIPFYHSRYHTIEQITRHLCEYSAGAHLDFYMAVHNKKSLDQFLLLPGVRKECLLEVGYPSLDNLVKTYEEYEYLNSSAKPDTIICLSRFNTKGFRIFLLERIIEVVDYLLGRGYRICYKVNPHYDYLSQQRIAMRWQKFDNFIFYNKADLSLDELVRSITIIDFSASMLYTYPLITKKPAIMLAPNKEWFKKEEGIFFDEDNFYDERLHIWANNNEEIEANVLALQNNKEFLKLRKEMIKDYISNETFAWGGSSEKVAEVIDAYIQNFSHMENLQIPKRK